ncbi:unnamed protein product, partial [Closterium sp. Naga37s-1]
FNGSATPAYTPHAYAPGSNWVVLLGWKEQRASLLQSLKLHEHLTRLNWWRGGGCRLVLAPSPPPHHPPSNYPPPPHHPSPPPPPSTDWTSRFKGSTTPAYTPHAYAPGSNWVVLLGWKEQRASLLQSLKLHEHLTRLFPPERVVIYREGSISLPRRKDLLNRALLMVSVHDNILADIVFMPPGSAVLEIRPVENPDVIFHQLADICEIEYYLAFCEGGKAVGSAAGGWAGKPVEGKLVAKDPKGVQKILTDISRKVFARANAMRRKGG